MSLCVACLLASSNRSRISEGGEEPAARQRPQQQKKHAALQAAVHAQTFPTAQDQKGAGERHQLGSSSDPP